MRQAGASLHRGARASHYRGLSCCGAQAPDTQAQQLWLMGLVAPWHVGSSQTRARTRVPCIGRQILNRCASGEALFFFFKLIYLFLFSGCVESSLLRVGFLLRRAGATLRCGARASHGGGFSCCGARALGAQASVVVAHGLSSCGSRALECRLSSCARA